MEYNKCQTCEAKDGRAGILINGDCLNCRDTKAKGAIVVHTALRRTYQELQKTFGIIERDKNSVSSFDNTSLL